MYAHACTHTRVRTRVYALISLVHSPSVDDWTLKTDLRLPNPSNPLILHNCVFSLAPQGVKQGIQQTLTPLFGTSTPQSRGPTTQEFLFLERIYVSYGVSIPHNVSERWSVVSGLALPLYSQTSVCVYVVAP